MAETENTQGLQHRAPKKNYSVSIFLFILGIAAVAALAVITTIRKLPTALLISEMVALVSLIGLLIVSISSKRRMVSQFELNERYPYSGVEKKEIEAIFDKIAEEEKKRRKLDAFAAGVDLSKMPTISQPNKPVIIDEEEAKSEDNKTASDSSEENDMIAVFPDDEESSEKAAGPDGGEPKEEAGEGGSEPKASADGGSEEAADKKRKDAADAESGKPRKKRPPEGGQRRSPDGSRQRRQRPYDPYYEEYYYDSRGKRHRAAPVYYDEYGNPIRPRVVYDEYGNPIRRRPVDPYGERRRPAGASGKKRRPAADAQRRGPAPERRSGSGSSSGKHKRQSSGPVAPVEMTPIKQWSNYGDDYIPVAIVDEEDTTPTAAPRRPNPTPAKKHTETSAEAKKAAEQKPYVPEYDEEESVIFIPDYEEMDNNDDYDPRSQRSTAAPKEASPASGGKSKRPVQEKYVPDYSEDEVVITLPDDDEPEPAASSSYSRQYQNQPVNDYEEEEDEGVVVLPHDEGYEDYMEQKKAEARKAERKAKGKTALTIRKLRQTKIRRKSRKYKIFRASVHSLTDYLNSYSVKTKR